jgi:hypothetical protein
LTSYHADVRALADRVVNEVGKHIVLGLPLGWMRRSRSKDTSPPTTLMPRAILPIMASM